VTVIGGENLERAMASQDPLLLITWHGRMMVPVWHMRRRGIVAMISRHSDGEMVSRLVEKLGYRTVRGSSTRGGTQATLEMLEEMRDGRVAAMICDGPKGPIYKMKPGAPFLAKESGASIISATFAARRAWVFHSWDRFQVPKPFSRVYLLWGDPLPPPSESTDVEHLARTLEANLNDLTAQADQLASAAINQPQ
jgi:lysophospholipid acyltransferase (LPLAT)-like uncharacterized protein